MGGFSLYMCGVSSDRHALTEERTSASDWTKRFIFGPIKMVVNLMFIGPCIIVIVEE